MNDKKAEERPCQHTDQLRQKFEAWCFEHSLFVTSKDERGNFTSPYTKAAFDGWCAGYEIGRESGIDETY